MKLLTFSSLYPNREQPRHGIFVEQRLLRIVAREGVTARVVAPVPWFPLRASRLGRYALYARVPRAERRHGLEVAHPRFFHLPKVGMNVSPLAMALSCYPLLRGMRGTFGFDVIDAHYFYPDGVAAMILGRMLGVPVVITGRGSDLNLLPDYAVPRRWIRWAAEGAAALITVCAALKERLVALGVAADKVTVLRNGVDLDLFRPPRDRQALRARLGLTGPVLLSVGNLVPLKGHELTLAALRELPHATLLLVGEGPLRARLVQQAKALGVEQRLRLVGNLPQRELVDYYGAADILVLASRSEGMANVLLESLACGTPVVASDVGGAREIVTAPEAGRLVAPGDSAALAAALAACLAAPPARDATRRHGACFSWESTVDGQLALYRKVLAAARARFPARREA